MVNSIDVEGFNIALNEARLLNVEFDPIIRRAIISLNVLSLPVDKFPSENSLVQIDLHSVNHFIGIYKIGRWDDPKAEIKKFDNENLSEIVQSFGGLPIYGSDFLQLKQDEKNKDFGDISFEYCFNEENNYKLWLFQASDDRYLEFHIWFNQMAIRNSEVGILLIEQFIAGGKRFWEGINKNDFRVQGYGIYPLKDKNIEDDKE